MRFAHALRAEGAENMRAIAKAIYWIVWMTGSIYFILTHPYLYLDVEYRYDYIGIAATFVALLFLAGYIGIIVSIPIFTRREK